MNVGLAQLAPHPRDVPANLARASEVIAASGAADLVVFPELYLTGYELTNAESVAVDLDGAELHELGEAAREAGTAVIVGAAERTGAGVANSAICLDSAGKQAAVYRKTHPFGAERDVYVDGDELVTVELAGRRIGVMICFDMEFPEVARTLARRKADMLVTISANPAQFELDHDLFARARALENGLPHAYVNRVGEQEGITFGGNSMAIDPSARVMARADAKEERILGAEIRAPGPPDPRTHYLGLLREELYDPGRRAGAARMGATGLEPVTSGLSSRRSPN